MKPVKSVDTYSFYQKEGNFNYLVEVTKCKEDKYVEDVKLAWPRFSIINEHGQTFYFRQGCDIAFVFEDKELLATSLTIRDFALYDRVMAVVNELVAMDVRFYDMDYENSSQIGRWVMSVNCSSEIEIIDESLSDVFHKAIRRPLADEVSVGDIVPLLELARYSVDYIERFERFISKAKKGKK